MPTPDRILREVRRYAAAAAPDHDSDRSLLDRFARLRDEFAFAKLVRRHGPMVLGVCRRLLGDSHAAEDAFQATFLVLAMKARSVRKPGSLGPWLHGVAARVARRARASVDDRRRRELPDEVLR